MGDRPVLVAHRAGNSVETVGTAIGRADVIELDVHVFRGRVEVRHEKVLWPTARLWERWYLLPRATTVTAIDEVLTAVPPDIPLLIDLKCFTRRAARRIRRALAGDDRPLIVSTRSWWVLGTFAGRPDTLRLRSCGNAFQLWLVTRLPGLGPSLGVVAHERLLGPDVVPGLIERTPQVFTWAVTIPTRARELAGEGITGLIVDDLEVDWLGPIS